VTRVLLITGARSLATRPGAEAWARGLIAAALAGCDLLIVGDADGPDAWAWESVTTRGREVYGYRYATRGVSAGHVIDSFGTDCGRWTTKTAPQGTRGWTPWLLSRNAEMVAQAAHCAGSACDVLCLALLDGLKVDAPGKRATRGTEHTVGLARAAGLTVREEVWRGTSKGATP
jgi:hypothetical protein